MNFRTTTILLIVLIGALAFVFFANRSSDTTDTAKTAAVDDPLRGRALFTDIKTEDIDKLAVRSADGKSIEMTKADGKWKILQPISWPGDSFEVRGLIEAVTGLHSRGSAEMSGGNIASMGLDKPRFRLELSGNGKSIKLAVGDRSAIGSDIYVNIGDEKKAEVVPGGTLETKLKPGAAKLLASLRDKQLMSVNSVQAAQFKLTRRTSGDQIILQKIGGDWKVTEPQSWKAEESEATDLISQITNLRANEFADDEASANAVGATFDRPRMIASVSATVPSTQPSTQPTTGPAFVTVTIGQPVDIQGDKVWVKVSDPARPITIAQASLAQTAYDKLIQASALSLRNRTAVEVDADKVSEISLTVDRPAATQPSTRPAEQKEFKIARRKEDLTLGPAFKSLVNPLTQPATAPATDPAPAHCGPEETEESSGACADAPASTAPATSPADAPAVTRPDAPTTSPTTAATSQPTTLTAGPAAMAEPATQPAPVVKLSKWVLDSEAGTAADDEQVSGLLSQLHPLRATKFLDKFPTTQPSPTYVLTVRTVGAGGADTASYEIRITDMGADNKPIVQYKDMTFEVDRSVIEALEGDFKTRKPAPPPAMPTNMPRGFPGGMPPGMQLPPGE